MKNAKKFLAFLLAVILIVSAIPMSAFAATSDEPEMSNVYEHSVFEKEGLLWEWVKYEGETMNWQDCTHINNGASIDLSDARYMEFDLVANVANASFNIWLSTAYGDSPARRRFEIEVKEGTQHVVVDLTKHISEYATADAPWKWSEVKTLFLQTFTITTDIDYKFYNVAFTTNEPPTPSMKNNCDNVVWSSKGVGITRNYDRGDGTVWGTTGVASWNDVFIEEFIDGGAGIAAGSVDASQAQYIEFDIYVSADMPAMSFWISSNTSTNSGRARSTIPATTAGWNHIAINLATFNSAGGVFGTPPIPYDTSALKSYIIETTINPIDPDVSNVTIKMANIAFTWPSFERPAVEHLQLRKCDGTEGGIFHPGGNVNPTRTFDADGQGWANNHMIAVPDVDLLGYDNITFNFNFEDQAGYDVWKYHTYFFLLDSSDNMVFYPMPTDLTAGDNQITLDLWLAHKNNIDLNNIARVGVKSVPDGRWHSSQQATFIDVNKGYTDTTEGALDFTFKITNVWANLEPEYDHIDRIDSGAYKAWGDPVSNFNWANFEPISLSESIDISDYDYLEFDIYVSDADKLRAEIGSSTKEPYWSSFNLLFYNTSNSYWRYSIGTSDLVTGYNHIRIPTNEISTSQSKDLVRILCYQEGNAVVCSPEYNYILGAVNFCGVNASAKLDGVYAHDMMFQQNEPIIVTGSGTKDAQVKVELIANKDGSVVYSDSTTVGEDGLWKIEFESLKASFDTYTLNFYIDGSSKPEKTVKNIIIGELYVASGQSNMAMRMWETPEGADWYKNETYGVNGNKNIRVFSMNDTYWAGADVPYEPSRNAVVGYWAVGNERDYFDTSAVAYNFADTMQKKLGIPVGVMDVSLGGSSIFSWISRDAIEGDKELLSYLKNNNKYFDETNWGGANAQQQMTSLYNMKVAPVSSMKVKGVIWYQGCNEVGIADGVYTNALKVLRKSFADTFGVAENELPFILVELAPYGYSGTSLPRMWDQMTAAAETYENMGAVTIYDLPLDFDYKSWTPGGWGIAAEIHPYTKKPVGQRLANAMYAMVYDSEYGETTAPVWDGTLKVEGKYAYLDFSHVGDGLATPNGVTLNGFSIANERGVFVNAKAEIVDENTVKVWSDTVDVPVAVSYCYDNFSVTSNLYGTQNGDVFLPCAPFITVKDSENTVADNNSWLSVDEAKIQHFIGSKFGFYDAWTAEGATAEIVTDVKDYGDGSLKLTYNSDSFSASPTFTDAEGTAFGDINRNFSFFDRIDFKVKNAGNALTVDKMAFLSNGVWYYANLGKALAANSDWATVSVNLMNLTDENGNTYNNSAKLSSITAIKVMFSGASGDGAVYVDTFELGNSTYGEFKVVPNKVITAFVGDMGAGFSYGAVENTAYIGDRYLMNNQDGADVSDSDYIEFDLYINDIDEVKRLNDLGYGFTMWISSSRTSRFANRCRFDVNSQLLKSGWNHIRVAISDITYKESGFSFEHLHYFYITCNNSENERTATSLYVKLSNFIHTVHAGDLTADGSVDMLDMIRMKKVQLAEEVEYDTLAIDVDRNKTYESAIDFVALKKLLFSLF